jgi:hypothetical protein
MMLVLVTAALTTVGCQVVHVQDQEGNAIPWAAVSVSQQGQEPGLPAYTDLMGNAAIPVSSPNQEVPEYLHISKEGYVPRRVLRPEGKVEIDLRKESGGPAPQNGNGG